MKYPANQKGLRYAKSMYPSRVLVYIFCLISIAATLYQSNVSWITLAIYISLPLVWPHISYQIVKRFSNVYDAERRMFHFDSVVCGFMLPVLGPESLAALGIFNIALIAQLMVNGPFGLIWHSLFMSIGAVINFFILGITLTAGHSTAEVVSALPLLIGGPALLGINTYLVSKKLYSQRAIFKKFAEKDIVSGINNRRSLDKKLEEQFVMCQKGDTPATLMLIDIDSFSTINEKYGQDLGDKTIIDICAVIEGMVRQEDFIAHYTGRFGILLFHCRTSAGSNLASRIRDQIAECNFDHGESVTVSIGLAEYDAKFRSAREWMHHTEEALYGAKRRGKNQVSTAPLNIQDEQ